MPPIDPETVEYERNWAGLGARDHRADVGRPIDHRPIPGATGYEDVVSDHPYPPASEASVESVEEPRRESAPFVTSRSLQESERPRETGRAVRAFDTALRVASWLLDEVAALIALVRRRIAIAAAKKQSV